MHDIDSLINSSTNLVYNFGVKGAGKTCFLTVMYKYFYENWLVHTNLSEESIGSINRIETILDKLELEKRVPPPTAPRSLHELDIAIKRKNEEKLKYFTFLDMAGEDLQRVFTHGELHEGNRKYLATTLNPIIICFVEYGFGKPQDRKIAHFFDYLQRNDFSFSNFAMIITKWDDGHNDNLTLEKYLETRMPQTYKRVKEFDNIIDRILKFSIGKVGMDNKLLSEIDTSYCEKVANWLYYDAGNTRSSSNLKLKDLWQKFSKMDR